jgi:hypothetical protein
LDWSGRQSADYVEIQTVPHPAKRRSFAIVSVPSLIVAMAFVTDGFAN